MQGAKFGARARRDFRALQCETGNSGFVKILLCSVMLEVRRSWSIIQIPPQYYLVLVPPADGTAN